MKERISILAIALDFLGFLLGKTKDFLLKSLEYLFTGIIFGLYYGVVYGIIGLIFFPFWIKDCMKSLFNLINNFLINNFFHGYSEVINGEIIKVEEKDEPFFLTTISYNNLYDTAIPPPLSYSNLKPIMVHRYILTIKINNMETYKVRVPVNFYREVKKQVRKGIKNISINNCSRVEFENGVYELSYNISS